MLSPSRFTDWQHLEGHTFTAYDSELATRVAIKCTVHVEESEIEEHYLECTSWPHQEPYGHYHEHRALQDVESEYVPKCHGYWIEKKQTKNERDQVIVTDISEDFLYIVMELLEGETLSDLDMEHGSDTAYINTDAEYLELLWSIFGQCIDACIFFADNSRYLAELWVDHVIVKDGKVKIVSFSELGCEQRYPAGTALGSMMSACTGLYLTCFYGPSKDRLDKMTIEEAVESCTKPYSNKGIELCPRMRAIFDLIITADRVDDLRDLKARHTQLSSVETAVETVVPALAELSIE